MSTLVKMKSILMSPEEFCRGAKKSNQFKKTTEGLSRGQTIVIDEDDKKRAEDWNILANQIMGSEIY